MSESKKLCASSESEFSFSSASDSDEDDQVVYSNDWCRVDFLKPPPPPPRFEFRGTPGTRVPIHYLSHPIEFFQLYFDESMVSDMVEKTNQFASAFMEKNEVAPQSRMASWTDTSSKEMKLFFSLLILQGIIKKPEEKHMWSQNPILCTPFIGKIMSEKRYSLLMKFLHFKSSDESEGETHFDPTSRKIWDFSERMRKKFMLLYTPERDVSIDESLMSYKGWHGWKRLILAKRARFGVKSFQLCESNSGYIWNFKIYVGKDTFTKMDRGLSTESVLFLTEDLLDKGYCLAADNFYCSPELAEILISRETDIFGTICLTRKFLPYAFRTERLRKGEVTSYQKGKMCIIKWKNKKTICMLSTVHNCEMKETFVNGKVQKKPIVVHDYNDSMEGVEKAEECLSYYPVARNTKKSYFKKIFRHVLNQTVWNSYVLYKKNGGDMTHLEFRIELIERLVEENCNCTRTDIINNRSDRYHFRLTGRHFPAILPSSSNLKNPTVRRCVVCNTKTNENGKRQRRETRYYCEECGVGLCVVPCFKIFHTQEHF